MTTFTSDEHAFAFQAAADAAAIAAFEAQCAEWSEGEVMAEDFFVSAAGAMKAMALERAVIAYLDSIDQIDTASGFVEKCFWVRESEARRVELRQAALSHQAPLPYGAQCVANNACTPRHFLP